MMTKATLDSYRNEKSINNLERLWPNNVTFNITILQTTNYGIF